MIGLVTVRNLDDTVVEVEAMIVVMVNSETAAIVRVH